MNGVAPHGMKEAGKAVGTVLPASLFSLEPFSSVRRSFPWRARSAVRVELGELSDGVAGIGQGSGEQSDPFAGVGGPEGESELVDGRVHFERMGRDRKRCTVKQ